MSGRRGSPRKPAEISFSQLRAATDELQRLVAEQLPVSFDRKHEHGWPAMARAFLRRVATSTHAVTTLIEENLFLDAQPVLRAMYEHVVTFGWLAIDPEPHMAEWAKVSEARHRALHQDAKRFGHEILSEADAAELGSPERKWRLDQRAQEVDDYWAPRISALREPSNDPAGLLTFRGMYTGLFRPASRIAHAEPWSLDPLMRIRRREIVVSSEPRRSDPDVFTLAIPLSALFLLIYRERFGWPDEDVAVGISDSLLYHARAETD